MTERTPQLTDDAEALDDLLDAACALAVARGHNEVTTGHLLLALPEPLPGVTPGALAAAVEQALVSYAWPRFPVPAGEFPRSPGTRARSVGGWPTTDRARWRRACRWPSWTASRSAPAAWRCTRWA
ncbi:Clp protease N-terminal domain-containing protein [Kitasatospora saccharophila]|uniref:Clp protease N-terminal domain-containing protein n=1 Tax=Kitasatospora saccharophila TaxID=407973 RepID=UPI003628B2E2